MRHIALTFFLLVLGCEAPHSSGPDVNTAKTLAQHGAVISALTNYLLEMQKRGILPVITPVPEVEPKESQK